VKTKKEHADKHGHSDEQKIEEIVTEDHHKENEDFAKKLEEKEKEAAANYDKYLRAVAELDNYKKRAIKEKADIIKYSNEEIIKDILPFMDSLDRALEHNTGDIKSFKDGIALIQEQLLCCLKKHGVERIDAAGVTFDPNFHEALMQVESDQHEENKIVSEMEKGYLLNGRLLRPSRVCVCKKTKQENNVCEKTEDIEE
jgi:molecular chaperone GrpE